MSEGADDQPQPPHATLWEIFRCFMRVGATAYGGPAMMPLMREQVLRRGWLTPDGFRVGLSVCQAIPGGTLMQLAGYVGLVLRGLPGALAGFVGFGIPATLLITVLSVIYHAARGLTLAASAMQGLNAVVLGIIALAVYDFWLRYAHGARRVVSIFIACALFLQGIGPAWIILGAALLGPVIYRDETAPPVGITHAAISMRGVLALACFSLAWLAAEYFFRPLHFDMAVSMAKCDLIAFGGYGIFPAMFHEVVVFRQWMSAETFMDGMALAQVTPGPFMLGACFVGYHLDGLLGALTAGIWVFTPSFFMLMLVVPCSGRLLAWQPFRRALAGVLSTLGGLILAVGIQLARGMDWSWPKAAIALAATIALWRKVDPIWVVLAGMGLGLAFL